MSWPSRAPGSTFHPKARSFSSSGAIGMMSSLAPSSCTPL